MSTRGKYKTLTLETKVEILKKVENGECKTKLAADYGIKKNTLSTYLKKKESILDSWEKSKFARGRKRMRNESQEDLEKALILWFQDARSRNFPTNGPLLQTKADELATRMGIEDFKCSDGWLSRFRSSHNISYQDDFKKFDFKKFKCDNVTFSDYVTVDEDVEVCGKLSDDDIIKTIREDEKEETLSDSEENAETVKRPNDQAIMDSIKTLKAFIQMEPSSENELKCLLQIEKLAEKCRHNKQNQTSILQFFTKV